MRFTCCQIGLLWKDQYNQKKCECGVKWNCWINNPGPLEVVKDKLIYLMHPHRCLPFVVVAKVDNEMRTNNNTWSILSVVIWLSKSLSHASVCSCHTLEQSKTTNCSGTRPNHQDYNPPWRWRITGFTFNINLGKHGLLTSRMSIQNLVVLGF